ncbi:MAG: hypothetical protein QM729_07105 [Solirubrobacterales bacterium]
MVEYGRRLSGGGATLACLLVMFLAAPAARAAEFGIGSFTTTASTSQAGAHADLSTQFSLKTDALGNPVGSMKDVRIELPSGVIGNPQAVEQCSFRSLSTFKCLPAAEVGLFTLSFVACRGFATSLITPAEPGDTQIEVESTEGVCEEEESDGNLLTIGTGSSAEQVRVSRLQTSHMVELTEPIQNEHAVGETVTHIARPVEGPLPLYNLTPFPGHVATFGTDLLGITILIEVDISSQGNLVATLEDASTMLPLAGGGVTLWGVPSDSSHDEFRCSELYECGATVSQSAAFMTLPTECSGQPLATVLSLESWQGATNTATATEPAPTGCNLLSIEPSLQVRPETTRADTPSGYEVGITLPQREEPYGLATPAMKNIAVTLPEGTSLSPAFAEGLGTCSEGELAAGHCPEASRIGTAEVVSPLLEEPLDGSVYFGSPTADVKYPLLIEVAGSSVSIHLSGRAVPDPATGRVTAIFESLPALPFKELRLNLFGGDTAALDNPQSCGVVTSSAAITAYGGASAGPSSSFTVRGDCGTSFSPGFVAGAKLAKAAAYTPFSMTLTRADGEADLGSFDAELPPGLIGLLRSTTLCGEPQAASGECPQGSQVGTATIGIGAGASPLSLSGPVYLTGPYGDAPFGLAVVIRGQAGPIDLGTVVVRSHLYVDQKTLALRIASEPLPQIVGGIPLRTRSINITLDKPEFIINPSTCGTGEITGTAVSAGGASHALSTPFSVLGCNGLHFSPHIKASSGAGGTRLGKGAGLEVRITDGGATKAPLGTVSVTLPRQLRPRLSTIQKACLPGGASPETACGAESKVGTASIVTPALAQPLTGDAYLVAHGGKAKPTLTLLLHGGGITQQLEGTLTISKSDIVKATFSNLPDIPIDELSLSLPRGPHSMLGATGSLCAQPLKLAYGFTDQSGRAISSRSRITVKGCRRTRGKG